MAWPQVLWPNNSRTDGFHVDRLQEAGGSLVMLAKGNRSKLVKDACKKHGGSILALSAVLPLNWP